MSHPVRVRELKWWFPCHAVQYLTSHHVRVRELKSLHVSAEVACIKSHPLRVRELKFFASLEKLLYLCWSHPVRVRELKSQLQESLLAVVLLVAPRPGA